MELFTAIASLLGIALLVLYLVKRKFSYWKRRGIPHDKPELFYGNLKGVPLRKNLFEPIRDIYQKYKGTAPFCGLYYFFRPAALILDLDLTKSILIKDFNNFVDKGLYHNEKHDPLTGHLFVLDGNKWRQLRKKFSPTFSSGKMKFMFSTVKEVGNRFTQVFENQINTSSIVEIKDILARYSTDVIGTCAFGIDCNSLKDPNAEFRVMGRKVMTDRRYSATILNLIRSYPRIAMKLGVRVIPDHINKFFMRVVKDTVEYREKNGIIRNDFMNIMIDMKKNKTLKMDGGDGAGENSVGLTMEELTAQAFVFYIGGFETSSTTMGFALLELAKNQQIQDKLRKEVNDVLAKSNGELTYESLNELHYMDQVIHETLRKYTILVVLCRQALEDYLVPDSNYKIEKGTLVVIPADAIHHDPDIYRNPEIFDPERFNLEEIQKRNPISWLPFGDGPRNCIGFRFGKMQMRIGLTMLLKSFRFDVCQETEYPASLCLNGQILATRNGINLKVEKVIQE